MPECLARKTTTGYASPFVRLILAQGPCYFILPSCKMAVRETAADVSVPASSASKKLPDEEGA